jgi:hypothetical protein
MIIRLVSPSYRTYGSNIRLASLSCRDFEARVCERWGEVCGARMARTSIVSARLLPLHAKVSEERRKGMRWVWGPYRVMYYLAPKAWISLDSLGDYNLDKARSSPITTRPANGLNVASGRRVAFAPIADASAIRRR